MQWHKKCLSIVPEFPCPTCPASGLFVRGQVDFTKALVRGQVNLGEIQSHDIQFRI